MATEVLKKPIRSIDLALGAARKRQSPRTRFVHRFASDENALDTIPIYENFCFAFALFLQKTSEAVMEGKELLERLLPFQTPSGNFPIYLHDFPNCWDFTLPLKIAPIFRHLLRIFGSILGAELREKMGKALEKMIAFPLKRSSPLWEQRQRALQNLPLEFVDTTHFSAQDWLEWIITEQIVNPEKNRFPIPYHSELQLFLGAGREQEMGEPKPTAIEWLLAEGHFSNRLLRESFQPIYCAPLFPFQSSCPIEHSYALAEDGAFNLYWAGSTLHSLASYQHTRVERGDDRFELFFVLAKGIEMGREVLFEATLFCDLSSETRLFVNGLRANVFRLGDKVTLQTPALSFALTFDRIEGEGDFCGHLFRSNRPVQTASGFEAYDWQIGLRTLRRSDSCTIRAMIQLL